MRASLVGVAGDGNRIRAEMTPVLGYGILGSSLRFGHVGTFDPKEPRRRLDRPRPSSPSSPYSASLLPPSPNPPNPSPATSPSATRTPLARAPECRSTNAPQHRRVLLCCSMPSRGTNLLRQAPGSGDTIADVAATQPARHPRHDPRSLTVARTTLVPARRTRPAFPIRRRRPALSPYSRSSSCSPSGAIAMDLGELIVAIMPNAHRTRTSS